MKSFLKGAAFTLGLFISFVALAAQQPTYLMPINCSELVPDSSPFLGFFESFGRGVSSTSRDLSRRVFRMLAVRERIASETGRTGDSNPLDPLIRKFLCFYREQKEPLRIVAYDDSDFLRFVTKEISTLEKKIDDAIFQVAFEEHSRKEYERRISTQRAVIDAIRDQADREAIQLYDKISSTARSKVRSP